MTQAQEILAHMQAGKSITPLEALRLYGCMRLGARVWELKADGWKIKTTMVGKGKKHFASYRLAG